MVLKRYRFTAELVFDIADLTDEVVRTSISHFANAQELLADEWTWKHAELEKRLLHALLNHPEVLARFVQKKLAELFESVGLRDQLRFSVWNESVINRGSNRDVYG